MLIRPEPSLEQCCAVFVEDSRLQAVVSEIACGERFIRRPLG